MKRHAKDAEAAEQEDTGSLSPLKMVGDCKLLCTKGLKVAVLQRSEDKPSLHNVDELSALVAEYTREPMQTLVVNDKMSFDEQVAVFRSFDVLISPPTPQLTNAMFASKNSVIIEVQSAAYDTISMPNGKNFVLSFVRSSGHLPVKMGDQSSAAKSILASHGVQRGRALRRRWAHPQGARAGRRAPLLVQVQGALGAPLAEPHQPVPRHRRLLPDEARHGGQRLLLPLVQRL